MNTAFIITAVFMTYDVKQKYCHAVGKVVTTQDKLKFTCQHMHAYFEGEKNLKLKWIDAHNKVRMDYTTGKKHITITGQKAHFEKQQVTFTDNPHVVVTTHD